MILQKKPWQTVMMSMSDVDGTNSVERDRSIQAAAAPETVEMTVGEEGMTGLTGEKITC